MFRSPVAVTIMVVDLLESPERLLDRKEIARQVVIGAREGVVDDASQHV